MHFAANFIGWATCQLADQNGPAENVLEVWFQAVFDQTATDCTSIALVVRLG
jgi:hypothetical protein